MLRSCCCCCLIPPRAPCQCWASLTKSGRPIVYRVRSAERHSGTNPMSVPNIAQPIRNAVLEMLPSWSCSLSSLFVEDFAALQPAWSSSFPEGGFPSSGLPLLLRADFSLSSSTVEASVPMVRGQVLAGSSTVRYVSAQQRVRMGSDGGEFHLGIVDKKSGTEASMPHATHLRRTHDTTPDTRRIE